MTDAYNPEQPFEAFGYGIGRDVGVTIVHDKDGNVLHTIPVAIDPVMRIRDGGIVVGLYVRLTTKDEREREVYVPVESLGGRDLYGKLLAVTGHAFTESGGQRAETRLVQRLLITATQHQGIPVLDVLAVPRWEGDRLCVPGVNEIPGLRPGEGLLHQVYGPRLLEWLSLEPAQSPEDAKDAWRTIVRYAASYPKLGLLVGLVLVSPYLERLRVQGRVGHVGGITTKGKTQAAKTAVAALGNPEENDGLVGTWNTTYNGAMARLRETGGMAFLLDETSVVAEREEEILELIPYAVAEGKERQRANREGAAREVRHHRLNVISTGERDLATSRGGAYSRVIQMNAPILPDAATGDMLNALAVEYAGWPIYWLVRSGYAPTELELAVPAYENPVAQRHARSLAAAKLVFDRLARGLWKDVDGEAPPVLDLEAASADLVENVEGEGSDADRLYEALWTDFMSRPVDYGRGFGVDYSTVVGRDYGDWWFVTTDRAQRLARAIGLSDIRPAMRALREDGRLRRTARGNRSRHPLRQGEPVVDGYAVVKPPDAVDGDRSVSGAEGDRTPAGAA